MKTTIIIFRNENDDIYGFEATDHGEPIVCAAVSILTINTINSIEKFTQSGIECSHDENGGFIHFEALELKNGKTDHDTSLLLNSMLFGLNGIKEEHPKNINIIDKKK